MPGRSSSTPKAKAAPAKVEKSKLPRTITLPRMNATYILLAVIILAAFILGFVIGVLFTKVQYLEKGSPTASATDTSQNAPDITTPVDVSVGHLPPQGDKSAKVKIVEFADFRCPYCEQFYKQTESQIISNDVKSGKAAFYFRNYAFLPDSATVQDPNASTLAANAGECANAQGKFWEMHDYFYNNQPDESDISMYTADNLTSVAGNLGMDSGAFNSCLNAKTYQKNVDKDLSDGQTAGVQGTPGIFVNGMLFAGACPYSEIKKAIDFSASGTSFKISGADGCTVSAQ